MKDLNGSSADVSKRSSQRPSTTKRRAPAGSAPRVKSQRKISLPFDTSSNDGPRPITNLGGVDTSDLFSPMRSVNLLVFDQSLNLGAGGQHQLSSTHRNGGLAASAMGAPGGVSGSAGENNAGGAVTGPNFTHRAMSYGNAGAIGVVSGFCDVDVILSPACLGYTLVRFRRIHGKTSDFHEAVVFISNLLDVERQQASQDLMPKGESELM
ncbi:hypothetical protein STCU_11696 [Strigomonas culicis]|uniref:Uncharacterized protein n=1 Tax=Strigomonas culicis TaxID=28005 RepID=S9UME3_9TRYP|nr:hypothetical protein STCU_11696 [Strigomonas culicis]|eukprot:EPY15881.1 hypothetical protein STCU_11696 [Strigomonas culicis]